MKPYVEDAIEQIATAEILNAAGTSTGERLAYIVCDNAIEFMMIAYTELEKDLIPVAISKGAFAQKKEAHHLLLQWTASQSTAFAAHVSDIKTNHRTRNTLYHTGQPVTVKADHVAKYLTTAKDCVNILFSQSLTDGDWVNHVASVNQVLGKQTGKTIKDAIQVERQVGAVKVTMHAAFTVHEKICIVINAWVTEWGQNPTIEQLEKSLAMSGVAQLRGVSLSKRIHDCRKKGWIQKGSLSLTARGSKTVAAKTATT